MKQLQDYRTHIRKTTHIALPIMLGHLGHVFTGIADTAMVGQIGATALAGAALGNSAIAIFLTFGLGISMAITPMVASDFGSGRKREIASWLRNGFFLGIFNGLALLALSLLLLPILDLLDQPADAVAVGKPYFVLLALSLVPLMIYQHFKQFAEGLSLTRFAMFVSVGGNLLNVLLNYLLIFGKGGFPRLELAGAGYATLIARLVMALLMFFYVFRSANFKAYHSGFLINRYRMDKIRKLWNLGYPIGLQYVFEAGAFVMAAFMIGWIGKIQLAAHQVALTLASATYMAASGLSSAATVRVGNFIGSRDPANLKRAAGTAYLLVAVFMASTALFFILFRHLLPRFFSNDPEVQRVASDLLIIAAFFQLSDGVQVVGLGILRGMKDVRIPTLIALFSFWLIGLPAGYALAFHLGMQVNGIWVGLAIGLSLSAMLMYRRYLHKLQLFEKYTAAGR